MRTDSGLTRRHLLGLGVGAAAAMAVSACGGSGGGAAPGSGGTEYTGPKVDLAMWTGFTGPDGAIMRQLVQRFNAEHANIAVAMSVTMWAEYYQKLPAAVSSGNGPDLGVMHVDSLATNAARNVIIPLDDVAGALQLSESDFNPVVWKAGVYKGKRFGIPLDMHPLGMYYNKTVLERAGLDPENPPQTREEYTEALDKLKAVGIQGHWMTPFPFTGSQQFQSLLWQHGGSLFNEDTTEARFNDEPGVAALSWMVSLVADGHSPPNVGQDADYIALKNGKTAFNWNGIWNITDLKKSGLQWGVAPLPQIGTQKAAWAGSHNFAIMQQRRPDQNKIDAAKVFINWLGQHSLDWAGGGQVPARRAVREDAGFAKLTEVSTLAQQLDYLHFPPPVPGIGDVMTAAVENAVNEAVLGRKPPKQALDDGAARAKKLLDENRKKYGS